MMRRLDEALSWLIGQAAAPTATEHLPIAQALGRVLAEAVYSPLQVPAFDDSQMDGYAVRASDTAGGVVLPISQRVAAGSVPLPHEAQSAARIFTGAPIPPGADAVVMQEDTQLVDGASIRVLSAVRPGQFVRRAGGDIEKGQQVFAAGRRLSAADIGLLASIGLEGATVFRLIRVGVFSSGDELLQPGETLGQGQIYDSNRPMVMSLVRGLGLSVSDLGTLPDDLEQTRGRLAQAGASLDVLLTCGGVSVGEEDHIKAAVSAEGQLDLWQIAIKPGKPFAYGRVGQAAFLGLPGNPVSAWVTFVLLVRPYLLRASGVSVVEPMTHWVPAGFDKPQPDARQEFLRASLDERGRAILHGRQDSQVLSSIGQSEGLLEVPIETPVRQGDLLRFFPFSSLLH